MKKSFPRIALAIVGVSLALVPETSRACGCCDWLFGCCKPKPVTYCPPPACPPAAAPCAVAPQQVNYVPQTCYRTEYTCVPVTTCKPVTTCDPCGNAQTVMQPMTTYVRRPVVVPYTTYRPVVTAAPVSPCATCGAAPYYTPAPSAVTTATYAAPAVVPGSGCSTCGGGAAAATYVAPAPTYASPAMSAPVMSAPAMTSPAPMAAPTLGPTPATPQPAPTFQPGAAQYQPIPAPSQDNSSLRPIPAAPNSDAPSSDSKMNSSSAPLLQDPQNRTTAMPLIGPAYVTTAIFRTAERTNVFKPAVIEHENWSAAPADDTWQSGGSR